MRQLRREVTASDSSSSEVHRREGYLATVQIKAVIFTLLSCTSTELLFSCCAGSNCLGITVKYLRRTTSGVVGHGLGTTIKYLWRATRHQPRHRDQTPATHNEQRREQCREQRPGRHGQVPAMHNERRRGHQFEPIPGITDVPLFHWAEGSSVTSRRFHEAVLRVIVSPS
jgi:hypothetical protein